MHKRKKETAFVERAERVYKILGVFLILVAALALACALYLKSQTPAYLFVNDTEQQVYQHFVGASSPGITMTLQPGEQRYIDLPWWQSNPFIFAGKPRQNFLVYKIYHVSDFPEPWWRPTP